MPESKYGKLMLELAVKARSNLEEAAKIALSSMLSTARANLSVGPPYDIAVDRNGSVDLEEGRIDASSLLRQMEHQWISHLLAAVADLPPIRPYELVDWSDP